MNPLWLVSIGILTVVAVPLGAYGLYRYRGDKRDRALARRRKKRISL